MTKFSHTLATRADGVRTFAPGRIEVAGNHLDHQGGHVIAAAITDGIAIAAQRIGEREARLSSEGFADVRVSLDDLAPRADEKGTTQALVRGVLAGCAAAGIPLTGFDAIAESSLPVGGGLSSSAAFELAMATAVVRLGEAEVDPIHLAQIGLGAERDFFGKPCGLMDQLASACGGMSLLDFRDQAEPTVGPIACDFGELGYAVFIIPAETGHAGLDGSFSAITDDMRTIARLCGTERLGDIGLGNLLAHLPEARREAGDLAVLRALHFFNEMELVEQRADALRAGDMPTFLECTRRSGASSAQYLQNIDVPGPVQGTMLVIALADAFLGGNGAVRIHGGGFGGSVQAFVPVEMAEAFREHMDGLVGQGSCRLVEIRREGAGVLD
ncbi:MAG: galactokinase [Coriobacteriales bacterium]|jgi:galactokinase